MKYAREILRGVKGYVPGEQPRRRDIVKLNTNENPYPPSPKVLEALQALGADALRRYPDPAADAFRDHCAERHGYPDRSWIVVGNGMDELLALALRAFVDPGDDVLAMYPTYSLYEVLCALHGCNLRYVDLDETFQLTPAFFTTPARLCFFTRPNAPTGVSASRDEVARFCAGFDGIVVIDEAYVDFAEDSCMDFPKQFDNVIVMRSYSKSFSLAGMRLGVAVAQPQLIAEFMKIKDSYNLNAFTQAAGVAAMQDYGYMLESSAKVMATRAWLRDELLSLGLQVAPSHTNFLLAIQQGVPSARDIFTTLSERGIYVRYFNLRRLQDALRITIGTDEQCKKLVDALGELLR